MGLPLSISMWMLSACVQASTYTGLGPTEGCTPKPNRLERVVLKFLLVTMGPEVSQGGTRLGGVVCVCWGGRRVRVRVRLSDQGWEGVGPSGKGHGVEYQENGPGVGVNRRAP